MSNEVEQQLAYEKLEEALPQLCKTAEYSELWGFDLSALDAESTKPIKESILRKFLKANEYQFEQAKTQLLNTLKWRKEFNPLSAAFSESHNPEFESVGAITVLSSGKVVTWNLYGAVKAREKLFEDTQAFLRWRVGLMERGLALMKFDSNDLSHMTQVHDYNDVSFFRLDSSTRAATKATIDVFQKYYPELLDSKYFVNVPLIMSWMFSFVKTFLSTTTTSKFHVLAYGSNLAAELDKGIPQKYGGTAEGLDSIKLQSFTPRDGSLLKPKLVVKEEEQPVVEEAKPEAETNPSVSARAQTESATADMKGSDAGEPEPEAETAEAATKLTALNEEPKADEANRAE